MNLQETPLTKAEFEKVLTGFYQRERKNITETREQATVRWFNKLPFASQYGVYLEYFDSIGINVYIHCDNGYSIWFDGQELGYRQFDSRLEAQKAAIEKAFEVREEILTE